MVLYRRGQAPVGFDLGPFAAIAADMERLSRFDRLELLADCGTSKEGGCPDAAERVDLARIVPEGHSPRDVLEAASERLATTLLWPLGKMPPGSELVIAPDGALHRLNFALLIQDGEYLFESTRLRIVPNGPRVVARAATHQQLSRRVFALGGAEYGPVAAHKICNRGDLRAGGFLSAASRGRRGQGGGGTRPQRWGLRYPAHTPDPRQPKQRRSKGCQGLRIVHLATHGSIARPGLGSPMNRVALLFAGANDALLLQVDADWRRWHTIWL